MFDNTKNNFLKNKLNFSIKEKFNGARQIILIIFALLLFLPTTATQAFDLPKTNQPKTVNLYWKTPITIQEAPLLAKWDMLALDMKAQVDSADIIRHIRQLNPNIIILAYTSSNEMPKERIQIMEPNGTGLWHEMISGIQEDWYLKTYNGDYVTYWPGNRSMNQYKKDYNNYLVNFYDQKVLSTGLWDGLLFDNIWNTIAWTNLDIDIDSDGKKDDETKINSLWQAGNIDFLSKLRNRLGDKYLILGNGEGSYQQYLNGRMFESFPEFWEGGWTGSMKRYQDSNNNGYSPRINIINADSDNTGQYINSSRMRYGLTSTLLYDGYYSFDWGTQKREDFWWYDEFEVNMGEAKSEPINLLDKNNQEIKESVWQRDFENGITIVNSTKQTQTINFDSEYEKIKSTQNYNINNGGKINKITLEPEDGTLLLRPIKELENTIFTNGSFVRIFNGAGENTRAGFFAYNPKYRGSLQIAKIDLDSGGRSETIVIDKTKIEIFSSYGFKKATIYPYGEKYDGGISIDFADINNNGKLEIITGPENGASNEIKIFSADGKLIRSWYAYKKEWVNLGVHVSAGDVNGDGKIEIIAGAGYGGGPHIKIFNAYGNILINEFFSYGFKFNGGTYVATGDINGDGIEEIITGAGIGGGPHVKVFDYDGNMKKEWFPYSPKGRSGVKVATADLDDNGIDEIITFTTNVFTLTSINNQ